MVAFQVVMQNGDERVEEGGIGAQADQHIHVGAAWRWK